MITPGPWHWVNPRTDEPWAGEHIASLRTVEEFGENKTEIRDGKNYTSWALPKWILDADDIRSQEDMRLIAAAPDHHAVALEFDRLMLVIESAVRHSDPKNHAAVMSLIIANRDAIDKATGAKP